MKPFILEAFKIIEEDLEVNIILKPNDSLINNYIATAKVYPNELEADADTANFIAEMTPLLFNDFKQMENVALSIRDQFYLPE
jgi:hypothetical protein